MGRLGGGEEIRHCRCTSAMDRTQDYIHFILFHQFPGLVHGNGRVGRVVFNDQFQLPAGNLTSILLNPVFECCLKAGPENGVLSGHMQYGTHLNG